MIPFALDDAKRALRRTPDVLDALLRDMPDSWVAVNEGGTSWSVFDVVGHLLHGERTDWIPRAQKCLSVGDAKLFRPFDRFAQYEESRGKTLSDLLAEFRAARAESLAVLDALNLTEEQLDSGGVHPSFGDVTLRQLLATWVAHDLDHIAQISRVVAVQYRDEVGPWKRYLRVMQPLVDYDKG